MVLLAAEVPWYGLMEWHHFVFMGLLAGFLVFVVLWMWAREMRKLEGPMQGPIFCPYCGHQVSDEHVKLMGQTVLCPGCRAEVAFPGGGALFVTSIQVFLSMLLVGIAAYSLYYFTYVL